jgi:UDP-3-O-[3-hydroxymyristoyl] glucosamine N-acyltransferase
MQFKLSEIAEKIGAELVGNDVTIKGLATLDSAKPETLTFITSKKYRKELANCAGSAAIVPPGITSDKHSLLVKSDPHLGFALAMRLFYPDHHRPKPGIEKSATIAQSAKIGKDVYIGHNAVICSQAVIGDNCVIHPGVYIGAYTTIGDDCYIYPNAVIMHRVTIGKRVAIYAGSVIGSDGFGYARSGDLFVKIPQTGTVVIEDDVEIGAGTTIDRASLGETRIGTGAILDNLIQIGHNCKVGAGSIICAQVGLAGSTIVGKNVTLAGQVGVAGHLMIGDDSIVEAQSGIHTDIEPKSIVFGYPAREVKHAMRIIAMVNRLPEYVQRLKDVELKIGELGKK